MSETLVIVGSAVAIVALCTAGYVYGSWRLRPRGDTCPRCGGRTSKKCPDVRLPLFYWLCPRCWLDAFG